MLSKDRLGARVRAARQAQGLTLKEVAAGAGLSAPHICEIEQGKTSPTIGALARIAAALGKPLPHFLEEQALPDVSLVRHGESLADQQRGCQALPAGGVTPLSHGIPSSRLAVRRLVLAPRQSTRVDRHGGQEGGLVLAGLLEAVIGDQVQVLHPGEVAFFAGGRPHQLRNPGPETAELLWVHLDAVQD